MKPKRILIYIIFVIFFIFIILPLLSNTDSLFGYVKVDEKNITDGESTLSISRLDTGEQFNVNVNNTKFYLEGNPIDENEIWEDIETESNYWVSLDKNRLPYRIFEKYKLEMFYMD
ncbi:hypothetical protein AQ616_17410 [Oceanobacillus sp. E9]|nr:hypothetical protein AQ616_17410 [Oceanobacillus sp. E9]